MKHTILLLSALCAGTALAQRPAHQELTDSIIHSTRYVVIDGDKTYADSVRSQMDNFYVDQFRHVNDPAAPYFMFLSRSANLAMGLGGEVMLRSWYDWNGAMPNGSFTPYNIAMHPTKANLRSLGATASGTKLFLRAMGSNERFGRYQVYVEGEFTGYGETDFALRKAYASLNDWTVGLAATTFSDPGALAPTVDRQGPNNKIDAAAILVRWMHTWKEHWTFAASFEFPAAIKMQNTAFAEKCREWAPDFGTFIQYQWGPMASNHVRFSGTTRQLSYIDRVDNKRKGHIGWGLQLSSRFSPVRPVTVYATLNGGQGMAGLGGDWMMNNYDFAPDPKNPGKMYAPYVLGYMLGVQYNFSPMVYADVVYSRAHYFAKHPVETGEYKNGDYGSVNLFYYLTPRARVGAGINIGQRTNFGGEHRTAYRASLLAAFSF